jgi:hypothetical protein
VVLTLITQPRTLSTVAISGKSSLFFRGSILLVAACRSGLFDPGLRQIERYLFLRISWYYSARYNCPLEKNWDIPQTAGYPMDHLYKTRFMLLYYSYSRPQREARGNHCHTSLNISCRRPSSYSYCLNEYFYSWRFCCNQPHGGGKTRHYWWPPGGSLPSSCKISFVA